VIYAEHNHFRTDLLFKAFDHLVSEPLTSHPMNLYLIDDDLVARMALVDVVE